MKPFTLTALRIAATLLLYSCERANENGMVSVRLILPGNSQSAASMSSADFTNSILSYATTTCLIPKLSPLSYSTTLISGGCTSVGIGGGGGGGGAGGASATQSVTTLIDTNTYSTVVPESSPSYPVNCLMVVVSNPDKTSLADFSGNYCGAKDATTGEIKHDIEFGPFVGLIPISVSSTGISINLELKWGTNREFHLLGGYADNPAACADIKTYQLNKSLLSKPYYLGSSGAVNIDSSGNAAITITKHPVSFLNKMFDDCVFKGVTPFPPATLAMIDTSTFPYNYLSSPSQTVVAPSPLYKCEMIDVQLKYKDFATGQYLTGSIPETHYFYISTGAGVAPTYATEADCAADSTRVAAAGKFLIPSTDTHVKRWARVAEAMNNSIEVQVVDFSNVISATATNLSGVSQTMISKSADLSTEAFVDYIVPQQIRGNTCYEGTAHVRNIEGHIIAQADTTLLLSAPISWSGNLQLYDSTLACENDTSGNVSLPNVSFPTGTYNKSFAFRWYNTAINKDVAFPFTLTPIFTGAVNLVGTTSKVFFSSDTSGSATEIFGARSNYKKALQSPPILSACSPLFVSLMNPNGNEFMLPAGGGGPVVQDLKWAFIDQAPGTAKDPVAFTIYRDSQCSDIVNYPIGSSVVGQSAGTAIPMSPGTSFYKLYIKTVSGQYGPQKMQLYYGSNLAGQVEFEITNPAH